MGNFADNIRPYVDAEFAAAARDPEHGFGHLERAHVLGQASTREHVRVHWRMLTWALQRRDAREFFGQMLRLTGAAILTFIGKVPNGKYRGQQCERGPAHAHRSRAGRHHRNGAEQLSQVCGIEPRIA
jgi:hypothetical protein